MGLECTVVCVVGETKEDGNVSEILMPATPDFTLPSGRITHVGIQIRRPANGRDSPTIDELES